VLDSYDRNFRRAGNGDFYITLDTTRIPFFEQEKGVYKTSFTADKAGRVNLEATGRLQEEILTSNQLSLNIETRPIEVDFGLNQELLMPLASLTGGSYHTLQELSGFTIPEHETKYDTIKLRFDSYIVFILIICLLTIDWILRRRKGSI
jgi:hypothetical protein